MKLSLSDGPPLKKPEELPTEQSPKLSAKYMHLIHPPTIY